MENKFILCRRQDGYCPNEYPCLLSVDSIKFIYHSMTRTVFVTNDDVEFYVVDESAIGIERVEEVKKLARERTGKKYTDVEDAVMLDMVAERFGIHVC